MNETTQNEDEKSGIGPIGGAASVAGGVALAGVAHKAVVDHNLKNNLAELYAKETEAHFKTLKASELFPADANAETIRATAEQVYNDAKHAVHETVKRSTTEPAQSLFTKGTPLGDAREAAIAALKTDAGLQAENSHASAFFEKLGTKAQEVAKAAPAQKESEAESLLKFLLEEIKQTDRANVAKKVEHVSWVKRMNSFSMGDLHMSGKQRGLAVAAGVASLVVGAIGIGKVAQWMGSGRDSGMEK